ncbi:MAG: hypothetical protein ACI38Q_02475 [Candidatus Bruticola sp.]
MSDIDFFTQLPRNGSVAANQNDWSLSENDSKILDEEAKIKTIELLKREDVITTSDIIRRFQNNDKEAAEILVRTFYPYLESLLIALEKKDSQKRSSERLGVAPALTSSESERGKFLNEFFIDFVNGADKIDFSNGVRLYLYKTCTEAFIKMQQKKTSSAPALNSTQRVQDGKALFFDDYDNLTSSEENRWPIVKEADSSPAELFFDDNAPKANVRKKISGTPVARSSGADLPKIKQQSRVQTSGGSADKRTAANKDKNIYERRRKAQPVSSLNAAAEDKNTLPGVAAGKAHLLRSNNNRLSLASKINLRNSTHLAPPLGQVDEITEEKHSSSVTPIDAFTQDSAASHAVLSSRANNIPIRLKKLAASDIEAYRAVTMRYFANCSFADLCHKLEVTSASEIGLRLLRGLLGISAD